MQLCTGPKIYDNNSGQKTKASINFELARSAKHLCRPDSTTAVRERDTFKLARCLPPTTRPEHEWAGAFSSTNPIFLGGVGGS